MSLLKFAVVAAAGIGIWVWLKQPGDPVSADARKHQGAIVHGLDREISSQLMCIHEGPFPFDTSARGRLPCQRCEDLKAAGLLTRSESPEATPERVAWRYELTDLGKALYTQEQDPVSGDRAPRLCLARTKVHHLASAQPALNISGRMAIGVDYVAEAVDPHPLAFDPAAQPLKLPVPARGVPALLPPVRTTMMLTPWGEFSETDPTFRYGSRVND